MADDLISWAELELDLEFDAGEPCAASEKRGEKRTERRTSRSPRKDPATQPESVASRELDLPDMSPAKPPPKFTVTPPKPADVIRLRSAKPAPEERAVSPAPTPKPPSKTAAPRPMQVISLRVGLSPLAGRRAETKDKVRKLTDRILASDIPVIALQGVWEPEDADAIVNAVRSRLPYTVRGDGATHTRWGPGLLVLSLYPLASALFLEAPHRRGERGEKAARGLLIVDVDRGRDGSARVINAQIAPVTARPPGKRRGQAETADWARRVVWQIAKQTVDRPVMLVGNLAPASLEGRGMVDALRCIGWRPVGGVAGANLSATEADRLPPLNPVMFHVGRLTEAEAAFAVRLLADQEDEPDLAVRAA